jgi:hypothetical protein
MGNLSAWYLLTIGFQIIIVIAVVGVIAYFFLRKTPMTPAIKNHASAEENESLSFSSTTERTTEQKIIAIVYLIGGLFGIIITLSQINGTSLDLMSSLAWLILLAQIGAAIYGGWQFWNQRPIGAQLLYWLSWSCVPVISLSVFSYWCAIGLGLFPTVSFGLGNFGVNFNFHFGYASELWFYTNNTGFLLGVNIVALLFVSILAKFMRKAGIPKWPLVW